MNASNFKVRSSLEKIINDDFVYNAHVCTVYEGTERLKRYLYELIIDISTKWQQKIQ